MVITMSDERDEQKTLKWVLDELKRNPDSSIMIKNILFSLNDFKARSPSDRYEGVDLEYAAEILQSLYLDGWFRPDWNNTNSDWLKLSSYGRSQLDLDYQPVILDPVVTIKDLKDSIPNIDSITLDYFTETLLAIKKRGLWLSATVTMGCASEQSILLLIEAILNYYNDEKLIIKFNNCYTIKTKFDLLMETIKQRNLKKDLLTKFKSDKSKCDEISRLFNDVDVLLNQMFSIYRINRNDAGHPSGRKFDENIVKSNASMFKKYCEVVYGLIALVEDDSK